MSKLLRSELKEIVKECLVEILSEGIGGTQKRQKPKTTRVQKTLEDARKLQKRKNYLESMEYGDIPVIKESRKKHVNTNITKDPILNSILADTAQTTLKEQLDAERKGASASVSNMDKAAMVTSQNSPEDLFGEEVSGKWAQLAFFDQ